MTAEHFAMSQSVVDDENPYASPVGKGVDRGPTRKTREFIFTAIKFAGIGVLVVILLDIFHVVSFTYRRYVDNDPLQNSIRVARIDQENEALELADGRKITGFWEGRRLAEVMKRYKTDQVEIVPAPDADSQDRVEVYASDFNFICEIGSDPLVSIPLFPINQQRFKRIRFGTGKCEEVAGRERLISTP